jgi:V8-like Glu-specific endopeptidase
MVRFKWLDAGGHAIRSARRYSKACRQPDHRPNLKVKALSREGKRRYVALVANTGRTETGAFDLELTVGDTTLTPVTVDSLQPREQTLVTLRGPACTPGTAVTASAGVNLVWTAGHCVTDGPGHDATNFMFVPGYYKGAEPNGRWAFTSLDSTPGWEAQGADRFTYDSGAARVVNTANAGATFAGTIGTRPISFGVDPTGKRLVAIGYPAAGRFNGSQQYACASPFRAWDTVARRDPMQISCDMTGGSSGGGWFLDANGNSVADAGETLVSNTSYGYQGLKNALFGPFLASGGQIQALYNSLD